MYCLKCGVENPDGAQSCTACGCDLVRVHTTAGNVERRVSRLAVVSLALAILHIVALSLALVIAKRPTMREVLKLREDFLTFFFIAVPISAVVLGLVSLVRIELSGGKLKGRIFAALGILISPMFFYVIVASTVLKTRSLAFRMTCGTHLSAIGRAML
ncbi:MAG: zinc ribbon domain-containing protein, partial [Phycisphaerales bacterium]